MTLPVLLKIPAERIVSMPMITMAWTQVWFAFTAASLAPCCIHTVVMWPTIFSAMLLAEQVT